MNLTDCFEKDSKKIEKELYMHLFIFEYIRSLDTDSLSMYRINQYFTYYRKFTENCPEGEDVTLPAPNTLNQHIQMLNKKLFYLFQCQNNYAGSMEPYPFKSLYDEFFCKQLKALLQLGTYEDIFEFLYKDISTEHYRNSGKYTVNLQINLNDWNVPSDFFIFYISLISAAKEITFSWDPFRNKTQDTIEQLITSQTLGEIQDSNQFSPILIEGNYDLGLLEEIYTYLLEYFFPASLCIYLQQIEEVKYWGIAPYVIEQQKALLKDYRLPCPINTATGISIFYSTASEEIKTYSKSIKNRYDSNILQLLDNICFDCARLEGKIYQEKILPHIHSLSINEIIDKIQRL